MCRPCVLAMRPRGWRNPWVLAQALLTWRTARFVLAAHRLVPMKHPDRVGTPGTAPPMLPGRNAAALEHEPCANVMLALLEGRPTKQQQLAKRSVGRSLDLAAAQLHLHLVCPLARL